MDSIGNRLREAREGKGLSIEDAAHQTRIQAIYIGGLENDDYSNFPSTTYAKSFLSLYSRFLEVDAEDALEQFAGGDAISLSGQGYLESVTDNIEPRRPGSAYSYRASRPSASASGNRRPARENSPGMAPLFLGLVLVALVIAIPTLWLLGKDADSFDEAVTKGKELTNTKFSTSDSEGEKADPETVEKPETEVNKPGPPAPVSPAAEPEPVRTETTPKETRVAQVTPPGSKRTLNTSPAPSIPANPVKTIEKPKITGNAAPLQAKPIITGKKPDVKPESEPPVPQGGPLRAVPLIARPVIISEDGTPERSGDAESGSPETGEETDPRTNGNQFPRPLE